MEHMILGHGIDIIEVPRIAAMLRAHPKRFLARVFTPAEAAYAAKSPKRRVEHLAARFAAKEAAMKALGTGLSSGIAWTDIEVSHDDDGRPIITLHNAAKKIAKKLGITRLHLSLSHVEKMAVASVVAEGDLPRRPRQRTQGKD